MSLPWSSLRRTLFTTAIAKDKPKIQIPKHLKPPKRAPGPYTIFFSSFVKTQPKATSLQGTQELCKRAGEIWKGYSVAEKQPFYDENEARKAQAEQAREEFFRNTPVSDLKKLNAIRKAQGKPKYGLPKTGSRAPSPFFLFLSEFRKSQDEQADINGAEKNYAVRSALAGGERWRSMSTEEKAPYFERAKKAKEELDAKRRELNSSL